MGLKLRGHKPCEWICPLPERKQVPTTKTNFEAAWLTHALNISCVLLLTHIIILVKTMKPQRLMRGMLWQLRIATNSHDMNKYKLQTALIVTQDPLPKLCVGPMSFTCCSCSAESHVQHIPCLAGHIYRGSRQPKNDSIRMATLSRRPSSFSLTSANAKHPRHIWGCRNLRSGSFMTMSSRSAG